jgi:hypothetical protein
MEDKQLNWKHQESSIKMLVALNRTGDGNIYSGFADGERGVGQRNRRDARRAKNRVARKSRKLNRNR